jgi:hypothetical protein
MARKMTRKQIKKAKRLAERLKGKPGISNPHALARWQVKRQAKKRKKGR